MGSSDELEAVHVVEFSRYFVPKQPSSAAGRDCPGAYVFGIAPYQVAESAFVGNLLRASYDTDLVKGADFGAQAAMHAEDFAVDDGAEDEEVEDLAAGFPDGGVAILGLAFFIETVHLGYLTGFVVAAHEGDSIWVSDNDRISQFSGYALACV